MVLHFDPWTADNPIPLHFEGGGSVLKPSTSVTLTGLLFARPTSEVTKAQILPHLDYFHRRSGKRCSFRCAGYRMVTDPGPDRIGVGDQLWVFDTDHFLKVVNELEHATTWKYSGGTELLLVNALNDPARVTLDMSSVVVCQLDEMLNAKAIVSVELFMERIFAYSEGYPSVDPTWGFSDSIAKSVIKSGLFHLAVSFLPKSLQEDVEHAKHYVVSDLSRTA